MQSIDDIIKDNQRYVQVVASSFNQDQHFDDLVSAGNIGIWKAYQRFDSTKEIPFMKYAGIWIRKEMIDYLTKYARTIYLPSNKVYESIKGTYQSTTSTISLSSPVGESGSILADFIPSDEQEDLPTYGGLKMALNGLKERDQDMMKMRFGMSPYDDEHTLVAIAAKYKCTRENVRIIINKVLKELKNDTRIQQPTI